MKLHEKILYALKDTGLVNRSEANTILETVLNVLKTEKKIETQEILDAIYSGFHKRWMHPMNETPLRQAEHSARHEGYWNAMFDMAEMFLGYEKKDVLAPTRWLDDLPKEDLEPRRIANELHNITCKIAAGGELPLAEEIGNLVCRLWAWRPSQPSPAVAVPNAAFEELKNKVSCYGLDRISFDTNALMVLLNSVKFGVPSQSPTEQVAPVTLPVPLQTLIEALKACEATMSPQTYIHTIDMDLSELITLLDGSKNVVKHLGIQDIKPPVGEPPLCPLKDRLGNAIYHGSVMTHPNGDTFVVEFCPEYPEDRAWRAK